MTYRHLHETISGVPSVSQHFVARHEQDPRSLIELNVRYDGTIASSPLVVVKHIVTIYSYGNVTINTTNTSRNGVPLDEVQFHEPDSRPAHGGVVGDSRMTGGSLGFFSSRKSTDGGLMFSSPGPMVQ